MPKLLMFTACEKALIDVRQLPSLISIFQRMQLPTPDATLPENAISPIRWDVFALWQHTVEEVGLEYVQRVVAYKPNGDPFVESSVRFKVSHSDDLQAKNIFELFGIPINEEGTIRITTWLNDSPEPVGEHSFGIKHLRKESDEKTSAESPE
jgi:hypothetical protein